jgi:hypothetical protein
MLDQTSLRIEELAAKEGSYIEACVIFAEEFGFNDFEDLIDILNPQLVEKVRQEFIERNYIPQLKQKNNLMDFMNS